MEFDQQNEKMPYIYVIPSIVLFHFSSSAISNIEMVGKHFSLLYKTFSIWIAYLYFILLVLYWIFILTHEHNTLYFFKNYMYLFHFSLNISFTFDSEDVFSFNTQMVSLVPFTKHALLCCLWILTEFFSSAFNNVIVYKLCKR